MDKQSNIYQMYTENIAPLTPMIAEQLKMDEDEYGCEAVAEAIRIAVLRNIKNMKYIEGILENRGKMKKQMDMDRARTTPAGRARYGDVP